MAKKRFKKILLWTMGVLFILLLLVVFGASFFANKIGEAVITELNKSLKSEIQVKDYDLTLVRYFPNAAVTLHEVKIPDSQDKNTLLEAKELAFRFGLFSLFGSSMKISSMVIKDGAMFVYVDKYGKVNYDVFKEMENSGEEEASELSIKLEEAKMQDVELVYVNEKSKQDARILIDEVSMSGEFSGNRFALKSDAFFETEFFETEDGRYFAGKEIRYEADVDVDLEKEAYKFNNVVLNIEENRFSVGGELKKDGKDYDYDLNFDGKDCSLQSLIGLLPDGYVEDLVGLESSGDFIFEGTVKGKSGDKKLPAINVELGLEDGRISGPQLDSPLRDVTFTANFTNGEERTMRSSVLDILDFKGYMQRELMEMKLKIEDLDDPKVNFRFNGGIPMDGIYKAFGSEIITDGGGDIEVHDFELNGLYEEMINPSLVYRVEMRGLVEFDDAMLKINGEKLTVDKGFFQIDGNDIRLSEFKLEGAGSDFELEGSCQNLLPVLLADSLNSKEAQLIFDARLVSEKLDIERLLRISAVPEKGTVEEEVYDSLKTRQIEQREAITNFLKGNFEARIGEFSYGKIKGQDFLGNLTVRNNDLLVKGDMKAMDGTFDLDGIIQLEKEPELKAKLVCKDIDGREFFRQSEDFGQDYLTHKNIAGRLDANILIKVFWDEKGEMLMDKLHVITDMNIREGELIGFKMLEDFSTFVKMRELRHIKFTETRNWIEIKDEAMYIPVMLIQNNAVNLWLSGEHTFNQDIDYNVKVNAGQVVMKKLFKRPGAKPIKAKNGLFNLYYRIKGSLEDYDMESAKKFVKEDFEKSEMKKRRIQKELEREFGVISSQMEMTELDDSE